MATRITSHSKMEIMAYLEAAIGRGYWILEWSKGKNTPTVVMVKSSARMYSESWDREDHNLHNSLDVSSRECQ